MRVAFLALMLCLASRAMGGYDVHITRRSDWSDQSGPTITPEEWKKLVTADPEMKLTGFAEATAPDGTRLRVESEGLAVWIKYSKHEKDGNMAWFTYSRGNVTVKNPDREIFGKMFRIAQSLGARLQGDEGEFYDDRGNVVKR